MAEEGICVAIRMRPLNGRERIQGQNALWRCLPAYNSITQTNPDGTPLPDRNPGFTFFTYDKVFGEQSNTQEVYEAVGRPIVQSVLQGFNGTIFAYGQTSSGKTYTMVGGGEGEEEGVLHLAARDIFQLISETSDRDFLLRVSYVEIYNENIRDLLDPETPSLTIREDPRKGVYIEASESIITDFDSIMNALRTGFKNRRVEATAMNERSSRSHTIFRMVLESKERRAFAPMAEGEEAAAGMADVDVDGAVLVATLNLVDLAGSESVRHTGATGNRAKEGGKINQSLLTLSRVIHALGQEGAGHIGFRDSKLTRILQPSLSGNAKMAVVCCITPAERYLEETRSTLQFASRAKMVKTRAVVNEVLDDRAQLKRLKKELQELKERQKQLESGAAMGMGGGLVSMEDVSRLEAEKELMSGKVEQLEAERHEQANKIDRLTNLILQGGGLMSQHGSVADPLSRMGGGRHGRRGKRLRETWCPGESKDLPPGAALRSLKELVEDDEADDRLVSNLNFGKVSKRRGGSSTASRASEGVARGSTSMSGSEIPAEMVGRASSEDDAAIDSQQPEPEAPMAVEAPAEQSQEVAEIRAILQSMEPDLMADDEMADVVAMVQALANKVATMQQQQQQQQQSGAEEASVEPVVQQAAVDEEKVREELEAAFAEKEAKLLADLQASADEVAGLKGQMASLQSELEDKAQQLQQRAEVEVDSSEHDLARLREAMGLSETSMSPAELVTCVMEDLQAKQEQLKQAEAMVQGLQGELQAQAHTAEHSRATLAAALDLHFLGREAVSSCRAAMLQAEVDELKAKLYEAAAGMEAMERLQEQVRELQEANQAMTEACQAAELKLNNATEGFKQLAAGMQAASANERNQLVAEIERLTGEMQKMEEQATADAQGEMARLQGELNEMEQRMAAERESWEQEMATMKQGYDALQQQSEASKEEAAAMRAQLAAGAQVLKDALVQLDVEVTGESLEELMQCVGQQMAAQASDLQARQAQVSALEARVMELQSQEEQRMQDSRASLAVRQSMGGAAVAGPPQPLLDELRQKLGASAHRQEEEDVEGEQLPEETAAAAEEEAAKETGDGIESVSTEAAEVEAAEAMQIGVLPTQDDEMDREQQADMMRARLTELETTVDQLQHEATCMQQEVDRLQSALMAAEATASEKAEEAMKLSSTIQEMQAMLEAAQGSMPAEEAQAMAAEIERLRAEVAAKDSEVEALGEKVAAGAEELKAAMAEAERLEEKLAGDAAVSEKLVQDLEDEIAEHKAEVEKLTLRLAEVQEQQEAMAGDSQQEQAQAEERLQALTAQVTGLTEQVAQKEAEAAAERQRVEELEAQVAAIKDAATGASSSSSRRRSRGSDGAEALEAKAKLQGLLVNEQNARQEAENSLMIATAELAEAQQQLRHLQDQYDEKVAELEAAQGHGRKEVERQVAEVSMREAEARQLKEQLEAATAELASVRGELNQTRSEAADSQNDDACLRKRVSQLQTQLDLAESKASKHEARVHELEQELQKVIKAADDEQQEASRRFDEAKRLADSQEGRMAELASMRESCDALSSKVAALKAERDEAEERASRAADAVDALEKELQELRSAPAPTVDASQASEMEALKAELEEARSSAAQTAADARQLQVGLRRAQQEVEKLNLECQKAREEAEGNAEAAREAEGLRSEKATWEDEQRRLQRSLEVMEGELEAERMEVHSLRAQLERVNSLLDKETVRAAEAKKRLEEAQAQAAEAKQAASTAEAAKAELLQEMNGLFLAECDTKLQLEQKEQEINDLKQALEAAKARASAADELKELEAQLAQKEEECNAVQGDNYRMKRELSELREAAEAAEVAIAAHTEEMERVQAALRQKTLDVARLERSVDDMTRDMQAKDERIKKLDKAKLTTDQVEKLQKLKREWAQFQTENERLKQELQSLQQTLHDMSLTRTPGGGASGEVAEALEAQSNTINELMAVRETLTTKLRTAQATARKLEIERSSVLEMLQELPSESIRFDTVPEDLSVAVGLLIEKYLTELAEGRKESNRSHSDRSVLINEVKTLTEEKESLKRKVQELEQGLAMSELREEELKGQRESGADKAAGAEAKLRELEASHTAAQEEATRSIRFLEKENLELMMEIKELKTRIIKLQTEVDTLRSSGMGAAPSTGGRGGMTPTALSRSDVNMTESRAAALPSTGKQRLSSSSSKTVPSSFAAAMHEKENPLASAAMSLRGVRADDTAPPFRSMVDDEDEGSASSQCKQS